ncbi:MAG: filamentous hemagglutinin N-terminal domain-containing protein [Spirulinaceae cyanobacterium]
MRQLNKLAADAILGLILLLGGNSAIASPIIPANDNTQTSVIVDGDRITINGGTLSGDGLNLFHSFEQFNLNPNQIADFLATPQLQNILGRVVGGNPSVIDGLIQMSNGSANLYLMNPAGIIFGSNAALNVPGDFFATTATGIGFGDNNWFEAFGQNDYLNLTGNPTLFTFDNAQPGAIVNAGDLGVSPGQNVTLLGGNVVNTGNINAPDGNILIQSVPGTNLVRISQPNSILSLEVLPPRDSNNLAASFTALDLPALLTGSPVETGLVVDGDNVETATETPVTGTTTVTGHLMANHIDILGDRVSLIDTTRIEGDRVRIGGDYQGRRTIPNAQTTFVGTDTEINSNYAILWADNTTRFYGTISAPGGFVEVSGKKNLIFRGDVDVSNGGQLLLDPENIIIVDADNAADDIQLDDSEILAQDGTGDFTISRGRLESLTGSIILEATNNIIIEDLAGDLLDLQARDGDTVTFTADSDNDSNGDFVMEDRNDTLQTNGGSLDITASNINSGDLTITNTGGTVDISEVNAGNVVGSRIKLLAQNNISTGDINTSPFTYNDNGELIQLGGEVDIQATNSSVTTQNITTYLTFGSLGNSPRGGPLTISAATNITTNDLTVGSGGVDLDAANGDIIVGAIIAQSVGLGGVVDINASNIFRSNNAVQISYTSNVNLGFGSGQTNASIFTSKLGGGKINIQQGGTAFVTNTNVTQLNPGVSGTQGSLLVVEANNRSLIEIVTDQSFTETNRSNFVEIQFTNPPIHNANQANPLSQSRGGQSADIASSVRDSLPLDSPRTLPQNNNFSLTDIQNRSSVTETRYDDFNICVGVDNPEFRQLSQLQHEQKCDEEILEIEENSNLPPHPSLNFHDVTLD